MTATWYYLEEDDDEKDKKGPFTLEDLVEKAPDDCLVSNDELLQTDSPWILLSEIFNDDDDENENDGARNKLTLLNNKFNDNKQIQISLSNMDDNGDNDDNEDIDIEKKLEQQMKEKQEKELAEISAQKQKERELKEKELKLREEREKELKCQISKIKQDEKFDEEWFILDESTEINKTLGPFTRWQLIKKVNENEINENSKVFLNGSKEERYLKMCGELSGLLPFIDRNATIQINQDILNENNIVLTKDELENKKWFYKDAYQQEIGPVSLSEIFYKLEDGILGRNSQIKQERELCWKTVQFIQKKFSKEWSQMVKDSVNQNKDNQDINKDNNEDIDLDIDVESDIDEQEKDLLIDPSFRALIDLDKKTQIEKKLKDKSPQKVSQANNESNNEMKNDNENIKKKSNKRKRKRNKNKKKEVNKSIYVRGLPRDITEYEIEEFFKKAGVIGTDIYQQGKKMIILYKKENSEELNGDALITYHQPYSVKLAIDLLDETEIRCGYPVHIKTATIEQLKMNQPHRKKRKLNKKKEQTLKQLYGVDSQLSWDDNIDHVVPQLHWIILKHMFTLDQIKQSQSVDIFINELKNEVMAECGKIGAIDKIEIYQRNPNGVIKIKYKHPQDAAQCIKLMNRRYFDGNIIDCHYWNGTTSYDVQESVEEQAQRLKRFQQQIQDHNT